MRRTLARWFMREKRDEARRYRENEGAQVTILKSITSRMGRELLCAAAYHDKGVKYKPPHGVAELQAMFKYWCLEVRLRTTTYYYVRPQLCSVPFGTFDPLRL